MSGIKHSNANILVADDQEDILSTARLLLKSEGMLCKTADSPASVLHLLREEDFSVVLLDMNYTRDTTSGKEGLALIESIRREFPEISIVVSTAWASIDLAVHAMKLGADDFITKPWDSLRLIQTLRNLLRLAKTRSAEIRLRNENRLLQQSGEREWIAVSRAMVRVMEMIRLVAPSDANILLTGENGTGKSLVARKIHALSSRANEAFISINMGGLPPSLFESEMFGHVRGAFTDAKADRVGRYELAEGGTLFMDEIGEMDPSSQSSLLRLLETGEFERLGSSKTRRGDVRFLSATNADLAKQVKEGRFRTDLFYRLNTVTIEIPPLRERSEDILPMAEHFLSNYAKRYHKEISGFEPSAQQALQSHNWPGNIRELDHAVERAALLCQGNRISPSDLQLSGVHSSLLASLDSLSFREMEKQLLHKALTMHQGNVIEAAKTLEISRSALYRRMHKHNLL